MRGIFNANKRKYLVIALTVLLVGVVSVGTASLTFSKYTDSSYKRTVSVVIHGEQAAEGGNPTPQPQEDPHIVTEKPNTVYQVKSGDTLSYIAEKFNVTLEALAAYNNIENTDNIQVGAILRIPPKDYTVPKKNTPEPTTSAKTESSEDADKSDKPEEPAAKPEESAAKREESADKEETSVPTTAEEETQPVLSESEDVSSDITDVSTDLPVESEKTESEISVTDTVSEAANGVSAEPTKGTE